jgi:predicted HTH domain antitoxin
MDLVISEDTLRAAHTTADELKQEVAVMLFGQDRLTLVQAAEVAGMSPFAFQHLLASREIRPHYGVDDFEEDLETLRERSEG